MLGLFLSGYPSPTRGAYGMLPHGKGTAWCDVIEVLAVAGVILAGAFLLTLGAAALLAPARATTFLNAFATSRSAHITEMVLRAAAGAALLHRAPQMALPAAFTLFGWALLGTTAALLLMPWQWHHRFARMILPRATRYITVMGIVSLGLGALILGALFRGSAR